MVSAVLRQAFTQLGHQNASRTMRNVADQLRDKWLKLSAFIDDSEAGVLAYKTEPMAELLPPTIKAVPT